MSARDHTTIEELLAIDALDALEAPDREELRSLMTGHGDCAACRDLEGGFREAAALLAASLAPVRADAATPDRILASAPRVGGPAATDELAARRARRGRGRVLAGAAAAIVVAVVASLVALRPGAQPTTVLAWGQRIVTFSGPATEGALAMAYAPGHRGVALWGSGLPDPGPGKTYELWMITGTTPTSGGCLRPTDGHLGAFVDARLGSSDLMAVTVEPASCPGAPTTAPMLTASLS
ncbi:MAG: anti-sigma factor domain-containing protein [Planctomycetaceae bacterium]